MEKESQDSSMPRRLVIRFKFPDGRVTALCVWPDGEWKVEVFATVEHAQKFARDNSMEYVEVEEPE